jgi:plasmid stabilization system protein ParE
VGDLPILPEAREEFLAAVEYYNSASGGLGEEFISDVENAVSRIRSFPRHGSPTAGGTRRVVLGRFPFDIVYLEDAEDVVVIAVAHQRRSPFYWRDRLQ